MGQKGRRNRRAPSNKPKSQQHGRKNRTRKHELSADEWTQAQQELERQLREMGLYCKEITGDGNCLFRSLSDQFYGNTRQHSKIRKEVCEYLEANHDHFQYFVEDNKTFSYHLSQMKKDGTYGGNMELVGFAQLYGVDIKIYQPGTIYVIEGNENENLNGSMKEVKTRRTLHIAYHNWEHYSSVRNIQGPHEGDPEIISEPINTTDNPASEADRPPNSIEKMIISSTGEENLTKIREMMKKLQFDHNEVINELIESSRKSSINGDGSNSKKVEKGSSQKTIDDPPSVPSLDSFQSGTAEQPKMPSKRNQEILNADIDDADSKSKSNNRPLSKKEKRKLRKKPQKCRHDSVARYEDKTDKTIAQLFI